MMIRDANPCFEGSIEELFLFMANLHHTGHLHICLCDSCMWTCGTYLSKKTHLKLSIQSESWSPGVGINVNVTIADPYKSQFPTLDPCYSTFKDQFSSAHGVQIKANHPPWQSSINLLWITKLKAVESRIDLYREIWSTVSLRSNPKWKRLAE